MSQTWTPIPPVTQAQAEQVRDIVIGHFRSWTHTPDGTRHPLRELPVLHGPNTGWGEHWCLVWVGYSEVPPSQWETLVTLGGREDYTGARIEPAQFPPELLCEGVDSGVLGIYPR